MNHNICGCICERTKFISNCGVANERCIHYKGDCKVCSGFTNIIRNAKPEPILAKAIKEHE